MDSDINNAIKQSPSAQNPVSTSKIDVGELRIKRGDQGPLAESMRSRICESDAFDFFLSKILGTAEDDYWPPDNFVY